MDIFANRHLDCKRFSGLYRCRGRDCRGMRFFKGGLFALILNAVGVGKERLVDLDGEIALRRSH